MKLVVIIKLEMVNNAKADARDRFPYEWRATGCQDMQPELCDNDLQRPACDSNKHLRRKQQSPPSSKSTPCQSYDHQSAKLRIQRFILILSPHANNRAQYPAHANNLNTATSMDSKQLQDTGKQVVKALESGDGSDTVLRLMSPLQKWTATEELLRQSKIGVVINRLRQNKDPRISSAASSLINKWKSDVKRVEKKSGSPAPNAARVNGAVNGKASGTSSPAPAIKKEVRKSKVDPEKRNSKADEVETAVTGNQTRDGCVKLMYDGLAFMSEEGRTQVLGGLMSVC